MEKIALVTGSSRGIGRAAVRKLAAAGYAVCINYRERQDCADALVEELTAAGQRAMAVQADVSVRQQVNDMVWQVEDAFGPVSLLVNNAGVAGQALFQDISDELWHRYFSVNVDGAFHTIQAVYHSQILLQATVIIAEWMRCKTNASLCFYKIYKILCRDPLFRVIFHSKCDNVSLKRIQLNPNKNREACPRCIFCCIVLKPHTVMIRNTDSIKSSALCDLYHILQS